MAAADARLRASPPKGLWYPTILGVLVVIAARRALLRVDLPPARHQPRRPARLPRRVHRPGRVHGACSPCCGAPPRRPRTRSGAGSRSGRCSRSSTRPSRRRRPTSAGSNRRAQHRRGDRGGQREGGGRRRAGHEGLDADASSTRPRTTASPRSPTSPSTRCSRPGRSAAAIRSSGRASSPTCRSTRWCSSARSREVDQPFGLPPLPPECSTDEGATTAATWSSNATSGRCGCPRSWRSSSR